MYKCKKSDFTFDPNDISSVELVNSNNTVMVIYKDSRIGTNGMKPIIGFESLDDAREAYEEISEELVRYAKATRPFGIRG